MEERNEEPHCAQILSILQYLWQFLTTGDFIDFINCAIHEKRAALHS